MGRGRTLFGNTNRLVDAVVGGWEVSPLYVYHSGNPWNPNPSGPYTPGLNFKILAPLKVRQVVLPTDATHSYTRLQGVNPCVGYEDQDTPGLIHPGPTYISNNCTSYAIVRTASAYSVAQNIDFSGVRLPTTQEFDASLSKRFAWNEKSSLQLRLDALNVLNHPNWSQVGGTGAYGFNNDPTNSNWGTIQKGPQGPSNSPRELQISGKFIF